MTTTPIPEPSRPPIPGPSFPWRKTIFLLSGITMGLFYVYGKGLRQHGLFYATHRIATNAVKQSCKGDSQCLDVMAVAAIDCAKAATESPAASKEWIDQTLLVSCLQKRFYRQSCKTDTRCVAAIDSAYDRCFNRAYPYPTPPDDVTAAETLALCLKAAE